MKAIFPNPQSLQPMPFSSSVHANISGNINSTTEVSPNIESAPNTQSEQNSVSSAVSNNTKNETTGVFYTIWCIVIFFFIFLIIIAYKNWKKNKVN